MSRLPLYVDWKLAEPGNALLPLAIHKNTANIVYEYKRAIK